MRVVNKESHTRLHPPKVVPRANRIRPDGKIRCTKCDELKDPSEFKVDTRNKDGVRSNCKACDLAYSRQRDRSNNAEYVLLRENPEAASLKQRNWTLFNKYGITIEGYDRLLAAQGGRCAICGSTETKSNARKHFCIDHDHKTGEIRGLLCMTCNSGIGGLNDDPSLVLAALAYLLAPPASERRAEPAKLDALLEQRRRP
jgi:hypothetical protein